MVHGLRGPVFGVTSACASSNHAFASAADQLRLGRADIMLAGGTDAPLIYGILKGWEALRAVARDTCRPFSADRDGLVLGEGAGMAVLETYDHAMARGATILAEIRRRRHVRRCDRHRRADRRRPGGGDAAPASPTPASRPKTSTTSTRTAPAPNPTTQLETAAIRRVFGKHADALSVSSTKSMHAHCMGASGALETDRLRHGDP